MGRSQAMVHGRCRLIKRPSGDKERFCRTVKRQNRQASSNFREFIQVVNSRGAK